MKSAHELVIGLALLKTTRAAYPALQKALAEAHPYEVPEILGLPAYRAWVAQNTVRK